jgi:hypothetical protein
MKYDHHLVIILESQEAISLYIVQYKPGKSITLNEIPPAFDFSVNKKKNFAG